MEQKPGSSGLRILVVEDEPMIATSLDDLLTDFGYRVVGPAYNLDQGMQLIKSEAIDGAVLDVNLGGERVFSLADTLAERSIPFVYVTGYGKLLRNCNHGRPVLQKPYKTQHLLEIIAGWRPQLQSVAAPC
jgi:CheY-like chemotaxis protein